MAGRRPSDSADRDMPASQEETTVTARRKGVGAGLAVLLAVGMAACAPQQQGTSAAAPQQGAAGAQAMPAQGTSGMQGHGMAGMDHQSFMAHCAQMRQQVRQGGRLSPDMQQMMAQCDQMDRSMGAQHRH
jgi:hypothetical protein